MYLFHWVYLPTFVVNHCDGNVLNHFFKKKKTIQKQDKANIKQGWTTAEYSWHYIIINVHLKTKHQWQY